MLQTISATPTFCLAPPVRQTLKTGRQRCVLLAVEAEIQIGISSQSALNRLVCVLTIVEGIQVKGLTLPTPP